MYTCHCCSYQSEKASHFLEFIGNVHIPDQGGIIGNNVSFGTQKQAWESGIVQSYDKCGRTVVYDSPDFRLYAMIYCLKCVKRILTEGVREQAYQEAYQEILDSEAKTE